MDKGSRHVDRHDAEERIRRVLADTLPLVCDMSVAFVLTIPWPVASPQSQPPFGQECLFGPEGSLADVVRVGLLVGENKGLGGLVLHVVTPVRLHKHGVYLL